MITQCTGYKTLLNIFSYDEQINEINQKINELVNKKTNRYMIDNHYEHTKNNIIKRNKLIN